MESLAARAPGARSYDAVERLMDIYTRDDYDRLLMKTNYPGIDATEARPLAAFLRAHVQEFDQVWFNVKVGAGVRLEGDFPADFRANWEHITRMRPDVVGWNAPDVATLIEVKVAWENSAVWQLLGYRDLYVAEYPQHRTRLLGVAQGYTLNGARLARERGIGLLIYPLPVDAVAADQASEVQP